VIFNGRAAVEGEALPANIIPRAAVERIIIHHGSLDRTAKGFRIWLLWLGFDIEVTCTREGAGR
jgi:hypothetical protein